MTDDEAPTRPPLHQPQPYQPPQPQPAPAQGQTDGLAVAGMVLGIVALLFCWVPFLNIVLAILAIVFSIVGMARGISRGMAIAGLVLGLISAALIAAFFISVITGIIAGANNMSGVTIGQ